MSRDRDAEIVAAAEQINALLDELSATVAALNDIMTASAPATDEGKIDERR